MTGTKRRTRVLAGIALVAASAAVASAALFGPGAALARTTAIATGVGQSGLPAPALVVRPGKRQPLRLGSAAPVKRAGRVAASATEPFAGSLAAVRAAAAGSQAAAGVAVIGDWWLDYAGTCSRTRGQPRTDVLA